VYPRAWDTPYEFGSVEETRPTPRSIRLSKLESSVEELKIDLGCRTVEQKVEACLERVSVHEKTTRCEKGSHPVGLRGYLKLEQYCGDHSQRNVVSHLYK
jgi:hypothetical protein